jgi:membrane protease YdiL (CAAX protease family)
MTPAAFHEEASEALQRRRIVVGAVLVLGATVLGFALRQQPGKTAFYWLTLALAAIWILGARASGPLPLGRIRWRGRSHRPVLTGITAGLLLGGVSIVCGLVIKEISVFDDLITRVLQFAQHGPLWLLVVILAVNGIGEEMFFRGALFTALQQKYPVAASTVVYAGAVMASGNIMLGCAAIGLGTVCALERRLTAGVLAPVLTHVVWGPVMLFGLFPLFGL